MGRATKSLEERLWEKVSPEPNTGCWLWEGGITKRGYGQISIGKKKLLAHRAAYNICIGGIPEDMELHHTCHNTWCVNPYHLEVVTHRENNRKKRGAREGYCPQGHPLDKENSFKDGRGHLRCLKCARKHARESYHRRKQT